MTKQAKETSPSSLKHTSVRLLVASEIPEMMECSFSSLLGGKKIDVNRRNLTYSIKISVSFSTAQEIENSYFCPAEDNFTKAVISTPGNRTTYLELASWEVSIFSLSARKRKESCMHASLKCENERKERASLAMKKRRPGAR